MPLFNKNKSYLLSLLNRLIAFILCINQKFHHIFHSHTLKIEHNKANRKMFKYRNFNHKKRNSQGLKIIT